MILENNMNRLVQENQALNQEKFYIMKSCIQNQSMASPSPNPNSFINSYDNLNIHNTLYGGGNDKENYSTVIIEDDVTNHNQTQKLPMSSNNINHMSVDQSSLVSPNIRMSQNYTNRNMSSLSSRASCDGLISNELLKTNQPKNSSRLISGSRLYNKKKDYSSTTSISFYKPHNPIKGFDNNRSSVSIKTTPYSQITERHMPSKIESKRSQLIKSKSSRHYRKNAHNRDIKTMRSSLIANYKSNSMTKPAFGVNSRPE